MASKNLIEVCEILEINAINHRFQLSKFENHRENEVPKKNDFFFSFFSFNTNLKKSQEGTYIIYFFPLPIYIDFYKFPTY